MALQLSRDTFWPLCRSSLVRDEQGLNRKGETGEMGAHLWFYFVPYEPDINRALQALRKREFIAGRYHPAIMFPQFPVSEVDPRPSSAAYASIEEALEAEATALKRTRSETNRGSFQLDFQVGNAGLCDTGALHGFADTTLLAHTFVFQIGTMSCLLS